MPICRVHAKSNYTVINNKLLRSKNLSCAATGLLCKVMSFPEDWDYTVAGLVSVCKEGITAINTMLKELKALEYFVPDKRKSGGAYIKINGNIRRIDEHEQILIMKDGRTVPIDAIYSLNGNIFSA